MRTPSLILVLALVGLAAGCSRREPAAGDTAQPAADDQLDLVLGDVGRGGVVSPIELTGEANVKPVAASRGGASAPQHARRRARSRQPAPRLAPKPAPEPEPVPVPARDPEPTIVAASAPAPEPEPAAEPADQPARGRGGWPVPTGGGVRLPGIGGGVIIIRGGHSGRDPCDEHDRHGIGGGMIPGVPGRIGGGFPGGIRFLRGH